MKRAPSNPRVRRNRRQDRECNGAVLILVLWVSIGLVSVALLFGHAMILSLRATDSHLAAIQAEQAIEGAARYAQYLLANVDEPGHLPEEGTYAAEAVPVGEARFWFLGHDPDQAAGGPPVYRLIDEAGKLNLNTATVEMLEALPRMTPELAAAILDWRDEDDEVSPNGAETQTYQLRQPAYLCKNAPFETVEELNLVFGAEWEILYGEDANRNGLLDPNENDGDSSWPPDDADGVLDPGIVEYVTVYTHEPNTRADGSRRINVNRDQTGLRELLEETLGQDRAGEILSRIGPRPNYRSVVEFYLRSEMSAEEFAQIEDDVTVSDEKELKGRINVNTASATVLACLPGMDETKAAQLVAARQSHAQPNSLAWIKEALDEATLLEIGPYITSRSYQVSADVAAVGRYGRGHRRALFVFDLAQGSPRIAYRQDLSGLGWSLGFEVFDQVTHPTEFAHR